MTDSHYTPLDIQDVTITDSFWSNRQLVNRERTLEHVYRQSLETGRIDAFRPGWQPTKPLPPRSASSTSTVMFWDSDVAKWVEAACYSQAINPDPKVEQMLNHVVDLIVAAQHEDGYLNTWFTNIEPDRRWSNLRDWHELYCAGHLIEAAVAHYQATGKRNFLDTMCRYVDYIDSMFGREEGKLRGYCGHPEIELALVRLAKVTGEQRYMELSRYFVEERGAQPHYYDQEAIARGENPKDFWAKTYEYNQAHKPVREQDKVVGHAVRGVYLYSAMVDLAREYDDPSYLETCQKLWTHLTTKNMYVMGGIGTSKHNEGFTKDYDLPNESAYAETCAAIGMIFWAQRLLQLDLDSRYSDVVELALYNAVISGISLDGTKFFYDNPLGSLGNHHRSEWFDCPCCPPNIARILANLGNYIYAQNDKEAIVHLYIQGSGKFNFGGQAVSLSQTTNYPWDGAISISVQTEQATRFGLKLRIPGWCQNPSISVNGQAIDLAAAERGYITIEREWQNGDTISIDFPMQAQRMYSHPSVAADTNKVALQRGPIVYCIEQADHSETLSHLVLPSDAELNTAFEAELFDGVVTISGPALVRDDSDWGSTLYRTTPPSTKPTTLKAIPYYAWDHREPGLMTVWIPSI